MIFLENPRLPHGNVTDIIVSPKYFELLHKGLDKYNITTVRGPICLSLPEPINHHPDCTFCHVGNELLATFENCQLDDSFIKYGFSIISVTPPIQKKYPFDAVLNAMILPHIYIHNKNITVPELTETLRLRNYRHLQVKQGYAACSIAAVDDTSIITSDKGIAKAAEIAGLDVLLISSGHILLEGYEHGFIGGTCGKLSPNILAFTGRLDHHPDFCQIIEFLSQRKIEPIFLTSKEAFDCGGLIPIGEV